MDIMTGARRDPGGQGSVHAYLSNLPREDSTTILKLGRVIVLIKHLIRDMVGQEESDGENPVVCWRVFGACCGVGVKGEGGV